MTPEDEFIISFLPVLRRYLSHREINNLDKQLDLLEQQLQFLHGPNGPSGPTSSDSRLEEIFTKHSILNDSDSESDNERLTVDLTFNDLKEDAQTFIIQSLGFSSRDELLKNKPELDGPIFTLEI